MLGLTDWDNYADIADAIRYVERSNTRFLPSEMADAIRNIRAIGRPISVSTSYDDRPPCSSEAVSKPPAAPHAVDTSVKLPLSQFRTSASKE